MVYDFLATCDVRSMALRTTNFLDPKKRQHKIDDSLISKGHQNRSLWERLCTLRNLFYFSEIKSLKNRLEPLAFPGGFLVVAPRAFFSIFHFCLAFAVSFLILWGSNFVRSCSFIACMM